MSEFFLTVVNMSISASWIVLVVLLVRLLLKKAPKWVTVLLWGIVAIRLICPFTIESVTSLIPSAETISPEIMMDRTPTIDSGIPIINNIVNPVIEGAFTPEPIASANPLQIWIPILSLLWIAGIAGMLIYTIISYFRVKRKVGTAVLLSGNIFQSESVVSPFVLGIIKPKIYLPFAMNERDMSHVVAHEQAHIRRKDHWWKPLGFLILTLHWFNPLIWLGYVLLCRDIELACDEKVIKELNTEQKADYSQAILTCSVSRRMIAACPLAFGEVGVKDRVKSVLHYKKPTLWILLVALIASAVVAVCFLTSPTSNTVQKLAWESGNTENLTVLVFDGDGHIYIENPKSEIFKDFCNIKISRQEISLDRSEDRDKSYTVSTRDNRSSGAESCIYFNKDFSEVWVDDGVKPTLSYRVLKPESAREIYNQMIKHHTDGTYQRTDGFETTVSYAGSSSAVDMWENAVNGNQLVLDIIRGLPLHRFDTLKDFEVFKEKYGSELVMDRGHDEVPSFNEVTAKYDRAFFRENSLLLVYVGNNNCTERFALHSVGWDQDSFYVHIVETTNAQAVDTAMAGWFVTIAVPDTLLHDDTQYWADLDNGIELLRDEDFAIE